MTYRSQDLRFKIDREKTVRHGRYNEGEERDPNGWNAQNSQWRLRFSRSLVIL